MELVEGTLTVDHFLTVTLGIVVLFIGKRLNQVRPAFREFINSLRLVGFRKAQWFPEKAYSSFRKRYRYG